MTRFFYPFFAFCLIGILVSLVPWVAAETPRVSIRLEIFCDGQLQPMEAQQWGRELNSAGFQSVQVRSGAAVDALDIQPLGDGFYTVSGMLQRNGLLLLPGGARFSLGQSTRVRPYIEERIQEMRQAEATIEEEQAREETRDALFQDLARPVGFRTKGVTRKAVLQKLLKSFETKILVPTGLKKTFDEEDLVTEELRELSRGTALAYVLRYVGYCVQPEAAEGGNGTVLRIVRAENADRKKMLPVGYAAEKVVLEELSERFDANVDGASAQKILNSLQERLEIPFLYDFNSMAGQGIEPGDVTIHQKPGNFSYRKLLDAVLFKAHLQREVRFDEAGKVFFWITTNHS